MGTKIDWKEVKNSIVSSVETRAKKFLDENTGSREFLHERAERFAHLAADYALSDDAVERARLSESMAIVRNTMELEIGIVLLKAEVEGRNFLKGLLGSAIDVVMKILPAFVPMPI